MPISDLTGTKWLINDNLTVPASNYVLQINNLLFASNGASFDGLIISRRVSNPDVFIISYGADTIAYDYNNYTGQGTGWTSQAYRTIEITGGSDVTNASLIAWLEANATQVLPSTPSLNFGGSDVSLFLGSSYVSKVYLGNTLLYEAEIIPDNAIVTADNTYLVDTTGGYLLTTETTLISFTVGNTTYQAESGWDFATWIESEYNTAGYSADSNNKVIRATRPRGHVLYLQLNGDVYTTDTIVANGEYSEYML